MKILAILLCLLVTQVTANTEAFYFRAPEGSLSSINLHQQVNIDEVHSVKFTVPSPNSGNHSYNHFKVNGTVPGDFYNARFSWSALDPIEIVHFDFVTIDNNNETGLYLYLETKYDCYSKDEEFMNSAHQIEAKILISSTYLWFIPSDIVPVISLIISLVIVSFSVHGYVFRFLKSAP